MRRMRGEVDGTSTAAGVGPVRTARSAAAAARMNEEARDALELAIVAGAPPELVERLAMVVGLSSAITDLSSDSPPILALTSTTVTRGQVALDAWREWQRGMLPRTG